LCRELEIYLIAGIAELDGDKVYNTAAVIGPNGKLIGRYHKQDLEHEAARMTAGKDSPVMICY
jgi:predicted amidohydrolase